MGSTVPRKWHEQRMSKALILLSRESSGISISELIAMTKWSATSCYYIVAKLERRGWVHVVDRARRGKRCPTCNRLSNNNYVHRFAATELGMQAAALSMADFIELEAAQAHAENKHIRDKGSK